MIELKHKEECCGCTACYNICPKAAIRMEADDEGFLYPVVDKSQCIKCSRCLQVCPVLNRPVIKKGVPKACIVRNKDAEIVSNSTSGGVFSAIAMYALENKMWVYGVVFSAHMEVVTIGTKQEKTVFEMRGSKFVQSNLNDCYKEIKKRLDDGEKVLFTGTPCQVAGLKNYLSVEYKELITMDFVCRGVASPLLWEKYILAKQKEYKSRVVKAEFKHKTYGYHSSTMRIEFENGKCWYGSGRVDSMMKAFVNELASRPSCSHCSFKTLNRVSDITMFDCYEYTALTGKTDDDKGYSSILVHSQKGTEIIGCVRERIKLKVVDAKSLIDANGIMVLNSAKANPKRDDFYRIAITKSIDDAIKDIIPITHRDVVIEKMKGILKKSGLIKLARKMKKETINIDRG